MTHITGFVRNRLGRQGFLCRATLHGAQQLRRLLLLFFFARGLRVDNLHKPGPSPTSFPYPLPLPY